MKTFVAETYDKNGVVEIVYVGSDEEKAIKLAEEKTKSNKLGASITTIKNGKFISYFQMDRYEEVME